MADSETPSIAVTEQASVNAKPDVAFIKLYASDGGMLVSDADKNVRRKVSEICEAFRVAYPSIQKIETFDVYLGQQEERYGAERHAFPRPFVVKGILVTTNPEDLELLHKMIDEGIKRGAVLESPHRSTYLRGTSTAALAFGLIASDAFEQKGVAECVRRAKERGSAYAKEIGKQIGRVLEIKNLSVESDVMKNTQRELAYSYPGVPTRFLSPSVDRLVLVASAEVRFELLDG